MSDTPRTDAMEYYFSNHDSCAGESLVRRLDEKDVTWEDSFMDDSVPADFARQLERELEQERQDRKQADLDTLRALGERNDLRKELEEIQAILANPVAVHLNMMRGTIQWTPSNLYHLLGQQPPNYTETP